MDEAEVHFRVAIGLRSAAGDRAGEARVTAAFGRALLGAYRFKSGLAVLAAASERIPDLGDDPALLLLDSQLARAYMFDEAHVRAVVVADRVLASAEHPDLIELVADTLITRGTALAWLGRPYEGLGAIETGHRLAARHGLDLTVARALDNIAALSGDSDRLSRGSRWSAPASCSPAASGIATSRSSTTPPSWLCGPGTGTGPLPRSNRCWED